MGTASPITEPTEPADACILTDRAQIEQVIVDLKKAQSFVTISLPGGRKVSTMILDVDGDAKQFVYDAGGNSDEASALSSSARMHFTATLRGVSIRFTVTSASQATLEGKATMRSPFPADMEYLQRREYFRTKLNKSYISTVKLPNAKPVGLYIQDVSLGGIAMQSLTVTPQMLPVGNMFDATLDFGDLGQLEVTLKIASHRKMDNQGKTLHFYGCSFYNLSRLKETTVQRIVFKLDQIYRANSVAAE